MHLEVTARRERRIQRRIQDARFPMLKTLDAFSFEAQPDLDRDAVLQVFNCRFVPRPPTSCSSAVTTRAVAGGASALRGGVASRDSANHERPRELHHVLTNPIYAGAYAFGRKRKGWRGSIDS